MPLTWTLRERMPRNGERDGEYRFDSGSADAAERWWHRHIKIPDGPRYRQPYRLPAWQSNILRAIYGWRRPGGGRRYRRLGLAVSRGNTKSSFGSGLGLLGLAGEHRPTARVIGAGTGRRNAGEIYTYSSRMVRLDRALLRHLRPLDGTKRIMRRNGTGLYEIIASDPDLAHGMHASTLLVDDLQGHKRDEFVRVLRAGQTEAPDPEQPAIPDPFEADFMTAGSNRQGIGFEEWQHWQQALEDPSIAPDVLAIIYAADPTDDIEDPRVQRKANPNLGVSVSEEFLRKRVQEAKTRPAELNDILRYQFNIWTDAAVAKYTIAQWKACAGDWGADERGLRGRACWAAVDLSSSLDLTAIAYFFPPVDGARARLLVRHFIPRLNLQERVDRDRVRYDEWERQGWIRTTPGDNIDEDAIAAAIMRDAASFKVTKIAYDRWGMDGIVQQLQKANLPVEPFGQGFAEMGPAMRAFDRQVYGRRFGHGGDPVLAWQIGNLVTMTDDAGNEKPTKRRSREKIDGAVAAIMAVGSWAKLAEPEEGPSVYERRGLVSV